MKELQLTDHLDRDWTVTAHGGKWLIVRIECRRPGATNLVCGRHAFWHPAHGWDTTAPWHPKSPGPVPADVLKQIEVFLAEYYQAITDS